MQGLFAIMVDNILFKLKFAFELLLDSNDCLPYYEKFRKNQ